MMEHRGELVRAHRIRRVPPEARSPREDAPHRGPAACGTGKTQERQTRVVPEQHLRRDGEPALGKAFPRAATVTMDQRGHVGRGHFEEAAHRTQRSGLPEGRRRPPPASPLGTGSARPRKRHHRRALLARRVEAQLALDDLVRPRGGGPGPEAEASGHEVQLADGRPRVELEEPVCEGPVLPGQAMEGPREQHERVGPRAARVRHRALDELVEGQPAASPPHRGQGVLARLVEVEARGKAVHVAGGHEQLDRAQVPRRGRPSLQASRGRVTKARGEPQDRGELGDGEGRSRRGGVARQRVEDPCLEGGKRCA